jgi:ATP-dependent helicase/nuclease subunit A
MSKTLKMTTEQAQATSPTDSVWVTASAGTGKTHVLTARVLRLLVRGTAPNKILCLTYTKAAANIMKNRIFKELGKWTGLSDQHLSVEINKRTNEKPDQKMLKHARSLFAQVLDVPGGMKIQTIHSFCQSLLGRFPAEASLTPHFQVMDERTTDEFLLIARDEVLREAKEKNDKKLLADIERIAIKKNEEQFLKLLKTISSERRHLNKLLVHHGGIEALIKACASALRIEVSDTKESFLKRNLTDEAMDMEMLKQLAQMFTHGTEPEKNYAEVISHFTNNIKTRSVVFPNLFSVVLTKKLERAKSYPTKGLQAKHPEIINLVEELQAWLLGLDCGLKKIEAFSNTQAILRLSEAIITRFSLNKRRQSLMDYDDLIFKTDQLLSQPHIAPWVLFKLDGGIDHILVDEAQDTNPEQWNMVETLSEEFFASASADEKLRSVFAVGDTKQSIFSFQGADPVAFKQAKDRIKDRIENADFKFQTVELHRSFRSTRPVLNLTDKVFSSEIAGRNLTPENETISHQTFRDEDAGLVELWPPTDPDEKISPESWESPTEQQKNQTAEGHLAIRIADKIRDMIVGGEVLPSKARPIMARDIMILVRRRKDFNNLLIRALKSRAIDVAGSDRMVITEQLAVMDLMSLAGFALLPDDDMNLAILLKSPLLGISEDDLFNLAHKRDTRLWRALRAKKDDGNFTAAYNFLAKILAEADFGTPFQFFSKVLNQGGRKKIVARLGLDANDAIDELLSLTLQYEHLHKPSLQGFVHWMSKDDSELKRDMDLGRNEVRILTVHSAKGLEAPIVFLADTCQVPQNSGEKILKVRASNTTQAEARQKSELLFWAGSKSLEVGVLEQAQTEHNAKQEAEHRRLLYVAMTRAEDRLYVCGWETNKKRPDGCWYNLISQGFSKLEGVEEVKQNKYGHEEIIYRYSSQQEKAVQITLEEKAHAPLDAGLPIWATEPPKMDKSPLKRPLTPSTSDETELASSPARKLGKADVTPYLRGNLIHKLLEVLPNLPKDKRKAAALEYLNKPAHRLKNESADDIWQKTELVLNHESFAPLFMPDSRAEVSLTGVVGENVVSAQIDRLKVTETEVLIVDYKTNRPPPNDVESVPSNYLRQMALYQELIAKIYPDKKIKSALLWTEEARLMALPENLLKKHL